MSGVKTMATVIERPGEAAFREVTLTPKRDDTVVCKTRMSAISTGTDMKTYHGMQHPEQCYYPLVPGYENMGVILEEGAYAPRLKKGDRVMINECRIYQDVCAAWGGGTLLVHKDSVNAGGAGDPLCKVPDNVTDEQAVLAYLFLYAKGSISLVNLATVSAAILAVGVWLVVAAVRRKPAAMLWAVVVLFAVAEILAMPYIGKLANNSGYHSIHATRNIPELEGLEFFHPDSEELRIDVVYEAGRKILPIDLSDSATVVETLPFVLVSQHRAEELLPATLLPHLDLRFIDRYDDNRQQPSDKHYTPVFINNVTLIQAAPEPVPSVVADSVGMGLVASASGLTACVTE